MTSRGKFLGGQAKFWGGSGPPGTPLAPPLCAALWVSTRDVNRSATAFRTVRF